MLSPKAFSNSYADLFRKKQDKLKDSFEKKTNMYERMLNDQIFSPRTYRNKKN